MQQLLRLVACAAASASAAAAQHVVPGQVQWPLGKQSWSMKRSSAMMICNSTGRVDPIWAARFGLIDLDWNGDKTAWAATTPMTAEEDMVANMAAVKAVDPSTLTWVYRNGAKALPWHTSVRTLLEDRANWGIFMPLAGCMPSPGHYVCGPNATQNLYHDYEHAKGRLRSGRRVRGVRLQPPQQQPRGLPPRHVLFRRQERRRQPRR